MRIETDFDLTNYNSYRIKAKCRKAYFPEGEEDIISLYKDVNSFIVLGSGHNIILSKDSQSILNSYPHPCTKPVFHNIDYFLCSGS